MNGDMIKKELIELDFDVENQNEYFEKMAKKLNQLGYVKDTFLEAILKREEKFPTALPLEPYIVAIPHVEPEHVKKPFIAVSRLKNPIEWREMAANENVLNTKFVFMLGFLEYADHVNLLQVLIENFQNKELMDKLIKADDEGKFLDVLRAIDYSVV